MQISDSDFAAQARITAGQVAKSAQAGAKSAQQGFNRFVEGPTAGGYEAVPGGDESKRAFWDDFSSVAEQQKQTSSSIGTAAMGKGGASRQTGQKGGDEWDDW